MAKICLYCARFPFEPFTVAPLGIGYIASYLISNGLTEEKDIRIVDSLEEAIEFNPDILGVSSVSQVMGEARRFAEGCKKETGCITIIGGYHITCIPHRLPPEFDIGVLGEGELTFAELIHQYNSKGFDMRSLAKVSGICYRDGDRVRQTGMRDTVANIDELPWPYRHKQYSTAEPVFTSRGCPFHCTYCASHTFWGDRCRFRNAQAVVDEISHIVDAYAPKEIAILDDLWIARKKRFREIVEKLNSKGITDRVSFSGFCRSNIVHEEEILLFKKLNYRFVRFGAETGSEDLLHRIKGDGISVADHQRVIDLCHKHRLSCGASFMFGVPGETREDIFQTVEFLRMNRGKLLISGFYLCNPIPGTPMWNDLLDKGRISENIEFERLQLDFLKPNFSWDNLLYFNEDNIPLEEFRGIIEGIKYEFMGQANNAAASGLKTAGSAPPEKTCINLEFGCGENSPREGFEGVDIRKFEHVKYVCNAWEIENLVRAESVANIYSRHFFEHLTFSQADMTLGAWKKILAPSGTLQIIVPDMEYHIHQFLEPDYSKPSGANPEWSVLEHAIAGFWGWQRDGDSDIWDIHKSGYNFRCLKMKLEEHGFSDVRRMDDKPWNLNIACAKRRCLIRKTEEGGTLKQKKEDIMKPDEELPEDRASDIMTENIGRQYETGSPEKISGKQKKVAIVRGANLNKWEMQNYEPLSDCYDITAYTTTSGMFETEGIKSPVVQLPSKSVGLLTHMEGLEDCLSDKDLVYSADITYLFSLQAVQAKSRYGCKVVCLEWENIPFIHEEHEVARKIKESVRSGADHFIAVTHRAREALILEGVPEEIIDVIPMGIDLDTFRPRREDVKVDRSALGIGEDEIVVLFIGRMVWEKGIYDFIHAAAKILGDTWTNQHKIRFLMVGKGPELRSLRERVMMLGIYAWTTIIEEYPYQEMYRIHNIADIFVLPSISIKNWQEQFGMVLIESMACGKPVISTLSGSIPEVVGDGGILVQPNDHVSLYEAIKKLIVDKDHRERLGRAALSRAGSHFDSREIAGRVRAVFEKVLSGKEVTNTDPGDPLAAGLRLWEEGDREKAFQLLCDFFNENPDNKRLLNSIIWMSREIDRPDVSENSLREYLQYHPADLDSLTSLAEILIKQGRIDQAGEELAKVFLFDPGNGKARALMEEMQSEQSGEQSIHK